MKNLWTALVLCGLLAAGCNDYPRDPEKSWEEAQATGLQIGLVDLGAAGQPHPQREKELALVRSFAAANQLKLHILRGSETELVEKLAKYELHVVLGSFPKKTVWSKHASPTLPYDDKHVLLVPKGENQLLFWLEKHLLQNRPPS